MAIELLASRAFRPFGIAAARAAGSSGISSASSSFGSVTSRPRTAFQQSSFLHHSVTFSPLGGATMLAWTVFATVAIASTRAGGVSYSRQMRSRSILPPVLSSINAIVYVTMLAR